MAELRSVTNARNSTELFPPDESIGAVTEQDTTSSVKNTSFDVRPDFVSTAELDTIEKEVSKIVFDEDETVNKYWNGTEWITLASQSEINDRVNEHSQGYIGLLSSFYFEGSSTETVIGADDVGGFVDVNLTVDPLGVFDNRPTDMKEDSTGYSGTGVSGDPYIFSLEGLDTTSFATFRVSMDFTPLSDEGQIESRILFDRHSGTSPSEQFSIEEVSLSMQQGAAIAYTAEPLLSFFVGDSIDTNAPGDSGKVRFQIKSNVEGSLKIRALTLYVNK